MLVLYTNFPYCLTPNPISSVKKTYFCALQVHKINTFAAAVTYLCVISLFYQYNIETCQ